MDPLQFAYWLQGFAELSDGPPSKAQWKAIQEHLQTVFQKITPPVYRAPSANEAQWQAISRCQADSGGKIMRLPAGLPLC